MINNHRVDPKENHAILLAILLIPVITSLGEYLVKSALFMASAIKR